MTSQRSYSGDAASFLAIPPAKQWLEDNRCAASSEWIEGWTACRSFVVQTMARNAGVDTPSPAREEAGEDARDAKRYRHLRRWWCSTGAELITLMPEGIAAYESEAEMDAAIDSAIEQMNKEQA
jgi:hypothetical protein